MNNACSYTKAGENFFYIQAAGQTWTVTDIKTNGLTTDYLQIKRLLTNTSSEYASSLQDVISKVFTISIF
jgi:hypothetical protein